MNIEYYFLLSSPILTQTMFVVAIDFIWILELQYAFLVINTHFFVISLDWFGQIIALAHPLTALSQLSTILL